MNGFTVADAQLSPALVERVLERLGLKRPPEPTLEGLRLLYGAWCRGVPFDNVRKLIQMRGGKPGPLPGSTPEDFLAAWVKFGTGGTCWSGAGALHAVLVSLGFDAVRGIATMMAAPNLPPNHGTVRVSFEGVGYLVDSSILHAEPVQLEAEASTGVEHPAWGLQCTPQEGRWHIAWRPFSRVEGMECRVEGFGASRAEYEARYEATRGWSPFNYELTARLNRQAEAFGVSLGYAVTLRADGTVDRVPVSYAERVRLLLEDFRMSEEIVRQLPEDVPTPPPPGSRTALARAEP